MTGSEILKEKDFSRAITRIAHEIVEKTKAQTISLSSESAPEAILSKRLQEKIQEIEDTQVLHGILDITLYRDDVGIGKQNPEVKETNIPFSPEGLVVVLCDDVLFTGRTIRAAIDALMDLGRPSLVQLAVLIDRGHRELPIRPDFVGKNIPTSRSMRVQVHFKETDGQDHAMIGEAS